jgi:formate hydrogenlyase transcriptional activator
VAFQDALLSQNQGKPAEHGAEPACEIGKLARATVESPSLVLLQRASARASQPKQKGGDPIDGIIGISTAIREVLDLARTVATTNSSVLIEGETGTGKELIARLIHAHSDRRDHPFVPLNCAALPHGLLESELFGHEKGAFTGAVARRVGRFEAANGGTLFLDEVGDIPLELQAKLLRVLQEQDFERLGGTHTLHVNVRLVAATNRELSELVSTNEFRRDLYYRLNVFPIVVPPLRDRSEDIPLLVMHFVRQFARRMGKKIEVVPADVMKCLASHSWPGNIRELQNLIERSVILTSGNVLCVPLASLERDSKPIFPKAITLKDAEREHIRSILEQTNWVVAGENGAAARLGMTRSTLYFQMRKMGISRVNKKRQPLLFSRETRSLAGN